MRIIWARLEAIFEYQPHWGSGLIRAFFRWYIPYFNAVSFPFARANEFQAHAASVLVTSARQSAQALTGRRRLEQVGCTKGRQTLFS
jgi:hypothetical protein